MRLIIHAPNVHQGGGRVLLSALLEGSVNVLHAAQLDQRFPAANTENHVFVRVRPTFWSRLKAEWRLRSAGEDDTVLCFGNLPPLFGTPGRGYVFLQNRLLLDGSSLASYPWKARLRLTVERWWLRYRLAPCTQLIVQTPSMAGLVAQKLGTRAWVLPFVPAAAQTLSATKEFDFIYVASGEIHKNHRRLVEAWRLLRAEGLKPSLLLTLSASTEPELANWITCQSASHDLRIELRGRLNHDLIIELYSRARCQIYPSLIESYGLPLVEASACGIPIVASERDYVRDVCTPQQTFDPESALSICRAVKRFLEISDQPQRPLTAAEFLDRLQDGTEA